MTGQIECRCYGRAFTIEEMALLRALIAGPAQFTRHALSKEFCRRIGWVKPDGGLKDMMARVTMLAMHKDGLITLPPPRWERGRQKPIVYTGAVYKASGWTRVGTTQGRGRYDRYSKRDQPKKDIWLRPLRRDWKRTLNR